MWSVHSLTFTPPTLTPALMSPPKHCPFKKLNLSSLGKFTRTSTSLCLSRTLMWFCSVLFYFYSIKYLLSIRGGLEWKTAKASLILLNKSQNCNLQEKSVQNEKRLSEDPNTAYQGWNFSYLMWSACLLISNMVTNDIYPIPHGGFKNHHEKILVIYYDRVRNIHMLRIEKLRQRFMATNSHRDWVQNPELFISTLVFYSLESKMPHSKNLQHN